jgi:hypothetical protein
MKYRELKNKDSTPEPRQITRLDLSQCKNRLFQISLRVNIGKANTLSHSERSLNVLDNIGIGMDDPLAFLSQFNIDAQSLGFLLARKNGARR